MSKSRPFERVAVPGPKLAVLIADDLRRRILSHELEQGENLPPERALLEQFGVSRPTLRQALQILEAESLIELQQGSREGARITGPTISVAARYTGFLLQYTGVSLDDVARARLIIEPKIAGLVAARRDPEILRELRDWLNTEELALESEDAYVPPSLSFHALVARLSGNETLSVFYRQLSWVVNRLIDERRAAAAHDLRKSGRRAQAAHVRFVDLVATGDADAAESFWAKHIAEIDAHLIDGHEGKRLVDAMESVSDVVLR